MHNILVKRKHPTFWVNKRIVLRCFSSLNGDGRVEIDIGVNSWNLSHMKFELSISIWWKERCLTNLKKTTKFITKKYSFGGMKRCNETEKSKIAKGTLSPLPVISITYFNLSTLQGEICSVQTWKMKNCKIKPNSIKNHFLRLSWLRIKD